MKLTGNQMQMFMQKFGSDPRFAKTCRELLRTGNEQKIAAFLKKNGFKF